MPQILVYLKHKYCAFHLNEKREEELKSLLNSSTQKVVVAHTLDEFLAKLPEAQTVICWAFKKEYYAQAPRLETIYTPAAGHDWIESDSMGKVEGHFGSFHGSLIAESFMGMMLYFNNQYHLSQAHQKEKIWGNFALKSRRPLEEQNLLIVGYGAIGKACAKAAQAFNMNIFGLQRTHQSGQDEQGVQYCRREDLSELLPQIDHVLFLLPSGNDKFFNKEDFNQLKEGAYLYSFGRGTCIDESAMIESLQAQQLAGAGLDVFAVEPLPTESPLWEMDNVLITPHSSCYFDHYLKSFFQELKNLEL